MESLRSTQSRLDPLVLGQMLARAREACGHAYAPYSRFAVGAAVLDNQNRIHAGCNVENASYGLTLCAEQTAVAGAVAQGALTIKAVAVYAETERPTPPCGSCRQVLAEFGREMEVHLFNHLGQHRIYLLDQLLPLAFDFSPAAGDTPRP